jgi:hypothetical protein
LKGRGFSRAALAAQEWALAAEGMLAVKLGHHPPKPSQFALVALAFFSIPSSPAPFSRKTSTISHVKTINSATSSF